MKPQGCAVFAIILLVLSTCSGARASQFYICPDSSVLASGEQQQFQLFRIEPDGSHVRVTESVSWEVAAEIGSISSDGLFSAGTEACFSSEGVRAVVAGIAVAVADVEVVSAHWLSAHRFERSWGGLGSWRGMFDDAKAIDVDDDGNLYVLDANNNRVQKFSANGSYLGEWGCYGDEPGSFNRPEDIAVDMHGYVYVTDLRRIQKFSSSGEFVMQFKLPMNDYGYETFPGAIAVDDQGNVYVADGESNGWGDIVGKHIWQFDDHGNLLQQITTGHVGMSPTDIAIDIQGRICILDKYYNSITRYGSAGGFLDVLDVSDHMFWPDALDVGPNGLYYVCHQSGYNLAIVNPSGEPVAQWDIWYDYTACDWLGAIAVDRTGAVYVASITGNCIKKYDRCDPGIPLSLTITNPATQGAYETDDKRFFLWGEASASAAILQCTVNGRSVYSEPCEEQWVLNVPLDRGVNEITVTASDMNGNAVSDSTTVTSVPLTVARAKQKPDAWPVFIDSAVVTAGTSELGDCFYIESKDRAGGIKVTGATASRGEVVSVGGWIHSDGPERCINAYEVTQLGSDKVDPLGISCSGLVIDAKPDTTGLLVRTWGRVVSVDYIGMIIDDGSGSNIRCVGDYSVGINPTLKYVCVTGIASTHSYERVIRLRSADDLTGF